MDELNVIKIKTKFHDLGASAWEGQVSFGIHPEITEAFYEHKP